MLWSPDQYYACLLTGGFLPRSGVSCSLADMHFQLVPAKFVGIRFRVVIYTSDQMVTCFVILVVYSHPGLLFSLQNGLVHLVVADCYCWSDTCKMCQKIRLSPSLLREDPTP